MGRYEWKRSLDYFPIRDSSTGGFIYIISLGVLGIIVITFAVVALAVACILALRTRRGARRPDAFLVSYLFNAMRKLERAGDNWVSMDLRSEVIADLARASAIVRGSLFERFRGGDTATLRWRTRQAAQIAAAFSDKQTWLMTPKSDTREKLLNWLARSLIAVISGAWDELEVRSDQEASAQADKEPASRRAIAAVQTALRAILIALMPALLFFLAKRVDVLNDMSIEVKAYLEVGVFTWAIITLLFSLDPLIKDKISAFKDAVAVLKPK